MIEHLIWYPHPMCSTDWYIFPMQRCPHADVSPEQMFFPVLPPMQMSLPEIVMHCQHVVDPAKIDEVAQRCMGVVAFRTRGLGRAWEALCLRFGLLAPRLQ